MPVNLTPIRDPSLPVHVRAPRKKQGLDLTRCGLKIDSDFYRDQNISGNGRDLDPTCPECLS